MDKQGIALEQLNIDPETRDGLNEIFRTIRENSVQPLQAENKKLKEELERAKEVLIERLEQEVKRTQKLKGENSFLLDRLQFEVKRTQSLRESIRKAREVLKDDQ